MAPDGNNSSTTSVRKPKENRQLKGLPVVRVQQDINGKDVVLDLHGFIKIRYETFLWLFLCLGLAPLLYLGYFVYQEVDNFGYNIHYILSTLVYVYTLDTISKIIVDIFSDKKARVLRVFSAFDDVLLIVFALFIPHVCHDPKMHLMCCWARDVTMATGSDIFRIYFWPDNLHNRKRVANFQKIIDAEGIWFWGLLAKTPVCRVICEHAAMLYFIKKDGPFDMKRILLFPIQVMAFELVTDFFYYWMHRGLHEFPMIYKAVHKLHHSSKAPTGINASSMSVSECFTTFAITDWLCPMIFYYIWPMTETEWAIYTTWMVSIEVYGHSGLVLDKNEMSLWRMGMSGILTSLGVRLMAKDHELHHWNNTVNYGKRTQIWDKLFNTYDYKNLPKVSDACLAESYENLEDKKRS